MRLRKTERSAGDELVPGVTVTKDFNFSGKTRWLNIHMLSQTGDTNSFLFKNTYLAGLFNTDKRNRTLLLWIYSSYQKYYSVSYVRNTEVDMVEAIWVHNINWYECTIVTEMKIRTCRIRSPSLMRPSLAAILFGSTCTKEDENQCWQPVIVYLWHATALSSLLCFFMKRRHLFSHWQPFILHIQVGFHTFLVLTGVRVHIPPDFKGWWLKLRQQVSLWHHRNEHVSYKWSTGARPRDRRNNKGSKLHRRDSL